LDRIVASTHSLASELDSVVWATNPGNDTLEHLVQYLGNYAQVFLEAADLRLRPHRPHHPRARRGRIAQHGQPHGPDPGPLQETLPGKDGRGTLVRFTLPLKDLDSPTQP
jgi:hypothetical protein